jgi:DNA-binding transcriptional LysR family regulator
LDLHQLYVFTKVAEHKSFSKAAEDIFLSQSTVSSHIQSLEKMLKMKLFDRIGKEIIITSDGKKLYQWALKLLELKDQALFDLRKSTNDFSGGIRLGASSVPAQFIIPELVNQFREEFPKATFHIKQSPSKGIADQVLKGAVDIGILGEKYENDMLSYIPLLKEKLVLITSKQIQLKSPVKIHELLNYPFIMRNSGSGTNALLEKFLRKKHIEKDQLNIIAYTESLSLLQFVIQGSGISIISEITAKEYAKHNMVNMYEIDDFNDERYFYLVYNLKRTRSLLTNLFIKMIEDRPF